MEVDFGREMLGFDGCGVEGVRDSKDFERCQDLELIQLCKYTNIPFGSSQSEFCRFLKLEFINMFSTNVGLSKSQAPINLYLTCTYVSLA